MCVQIWKNTRHSEDDFINELYPIHIIYILSMNNMILFMNNIFWIPCVFLYLYIYTAITQERCEQYWTSSGCNTPQGTNYTSTCLPSRKLSKLDELDMQDTAGEAGTSS